MRFAHRKAPEGDRLPLTSLIDVVFLLLIYFIVTARFAEHESELAAALRSDDQTASSSDLSPQVLSVEPSPETGAVFRIGARETTQREGVVAVLKELPKERGVFIKVSDAAPVWAAAAAWQAARDAGFTKVTYAPAP